MNCIGPCLNHCYKNYNIITLLFGILIGFNINFIINNSKNSTLNN